MDIHSRQKEEAFGIYYLVQAQARAQVGMYKNKKRSVGKDGDGKDK